MDGQTKVIAQVIQERRMQDRQWGGATHDDTRSYAEWIDYIEHQFSLLDLRVGGNARERFIKVAALAVAAAEMIDRKAI